MPAHECTRFDNRQRSAPGEQAAQDDQRQLRGWRGATSAGFAFLVESKLPSEKQVLGDDLRAPAKQDPYQVSNQRQAG